VIDVTMAPPEEIKDFEADDKTIIMGTG